MNIKDEIYPKVKADARMADDKTLWIKVGAEFEKVDRVILEDGSIFCKVFYQDAEPEIIRCQNCKYYDGRPCGNVDWYNTDSDYCSRAEGRTDE